LRTGRGLWGMTLLARRCLSRTISLSIAFLTAPFAACNDGASPATPAAVRATEGDGQEAPIRNPLPKPVVATVVDETGMPLARVPVSWSLEGDGAIEAVDSETDSRGRVRARWILGETVGARTAAASVEGLEPARFSATAGPPDELPLGDLRLIAPPTYDGSGEVVHPDYVRSPSEVFRFPHHLAITPYPGGNSVYENPSLFVTARLSQPWQLEPETPNPLVLPTAGYFSDPDLVYVPEGKQLWLYYRQATSSNTIWLIRSADGVHWSDRLEVARRPSHEIISPTVVRRGPGDWWMWAVNGGQAGCGGSRTTVEVRRSTDGQQWSEPVPVALAQPELWPWHIEVQWIPSREEFWALYNAKQPGSCTTPALFLATSPDGVAWTVLSQPVLVKGRIPQFQDIVYRSTMIYEPASDAVTFWYSGARYDGARYMWSAAAERRPRKELFAPAPALRTRTFTPAPAPLEEWP
jgi:hypothetical protein